MKEYIYQLYVHGQKHGLATSMVGANGKGLKI